MHLDGYCLSRGIPEEAVEQSTITIHDVLVYSDRLITAELPIKKYIFEGAGFLLDCNPSSSHIGPWVLNT